MHKTGKIIVCLFTGIATLLVPLSGNNQTNGNRRPSRPSPQDLPVELRPPHPPEKIEARYTIDAKRNGEDINGEDALPRSHEFLRIDSTYYVGWMFEGTYKYNHAADFLGYRNASVPLEKALGLMERDYAKMLSTRTDNLLVYYPTHFFKSDYCLIAYYLMNCYSYTDQQEKVYTLLRRVLKWKFQHHYVMDAYNYLSWTVHRNRFYTSSKYCFLKNSIDENEKLANRFLDSCMMLIDKNKELNRTIIPEMEEGERLSVYDYKNILFSYSFKIDSANFYFNLMRRAGRLPHNNFANFKVVCGDFRTADAEYNIASSQDIGDKRLQEWAYYSTILDIYKAKPKTGKELAENMIKTSGSTPGFGWYNIALARCLIYDGQVHESQPFTDKAAEFKELHIGTTLGQSHYDFSIQLLKMLTKEQQFQMQQFEHRNWFFNPKVLSNMAELLVEKYLQQFLIINQFAQNPERDRVIYKLFSTESTISWDEVWYLVHDFSTRFFLKRFQKESESDNRKYIKKYFDLFVARLKIQQGNFKEAKPILDRLLEDPNIDLEYEKLFVARIYQCEALCAADRKDEYDKNIWLYRLYSIYPQLVPFTGIQMNLNLHLVGDVDKDVEKTLRACNINWVTNTNVPAPQVYISFNKTGTKKEITYYVIDRSGDYVVKKQNFVWQKAEETGISLAYKIFNIGGNNFDIETAKQ